MIYETRCQQCLTADKRLRFTSPKLPSATSFIRNTSGERANKVYD